MMTRFMVQAPVLAVAAGVVLGPAGSAVAQEALPPAEQVIERYVTAIGGRDAVLGHTNSRATGTFSMPAAGISGSMVVESLEGRVATVLEIPGLGTIRSGFDGEVAWSLDPNLGPRVLEGMELASTTEGANPLGAVRDASLFSVRETVERTEMNGQACYKVRLVWQSGRETHDCYGVDSGLLVGQTSSQETPMGTIRAITLLEDYQETGGVLSARRIRQQVMGQEQVMTLESIEYGVVGPESFELPEAIRTLVRTDAGQ
jgi:hypothetical protein